MNTIEKKEYAEKVKEIRRLLHQDIAVAGRIILANVLDWLLLYVLVFFPSFRELVATSGSEQVYFSLFLPSMILSFIVTLITGGVSPGKILMDIRFVSTKTFARIHREDYMSYLGSKIWLGYKYENIYETYRFFTSEYGQNIAMEEHGIVLVPRRKIKKLEKFKESIEFKLQKAIFSDNLYDNTESKILSANHSRIFKDE